MNEERSSGWISLPLGGIQYDVDLWAAEGFRAQPLATIRLDLSRPGHSERGPLQEPKQGPRLATVGIIS